MQTHKKQSNEKQKITDDKLSQVRFLHNVFGAPNVDVYVGINRIAENLQYQEFTGYLDVYSQDLVITIKKTGTKTVLGTKSFSIENCKYYSFIITGDVTNLSTIDILAFNDRLTKPKCGNTYVRFIHGAYGAPPVDIYVDSEEIFSNVSFGKNGNPSYAKIELNEPVDGQNCLFFFGLEIKLAGKDTVVAGPLPMNLQDRGVYTIVASGSVNSGLTAVLTKDNFVCQ